VSDQQGIVQRIKELINPPAAPVMIKVTLTPPPGMSFKNEFGGDVTITLEKGRAHELYEHLFNQIAALHDV
jgi:hypothetical protein